MNKLPENSKIEFDRNSINEKIVLPQKSGGAFKYLIGAFLIFWLCGWAFGWVSAFSEIVTDSDAPDAFLIFWLCGWTVGGGFAIWYLYKIVRPAIPETLEFSNPTIIYDSGVAPIQFSFGFISGMEMWKKIFQKRIRVEFDRISIETIKIREFQSGNRLTIDYKNKRIDLGTGITEIEREWLYNYIKSKYSS